MAKKKTMPLSWDSIKELVKQKLNEGRERDDYGYVRKQAWIREIWDGEVVYQDDLDGKTYRRTYTLDETTMAATLGDAEAVVEVSSYQSVSFSADLASFTAAGDMVTYTGKLFELGSYPDKGFSLSAEEADNQIAAFSPVPNDLEHSKTILSGKLGSVQQLWRDGASLFGKVQVPKWLHDTVGGPLKTSLAFDATTKAIIGNALVVAPRIPDAALVAAFNQSQVPLPNPAPKEVRMSFIDKLRAMAKGGQGAPTEEEVAAAARAEFSATPAPTPSPAPVSDPAMAAELAALKASRVNDRAVAFTQALIASGQILPAQAPHLQVLFTAAAKADGGGTVTFSAEGTIAEGDALKALQAFAESLPKGKLLDPAVNFNLLGAAEGDPSAIAPISIDVKEVVK